MMHICIVLHLIFKWLVNCPFSHFIPNIFYFSCEPSLSSFHFQGLKKLINGPQKKINPFIYKIRKRRDFKVSKARNSNSIYSLTSYFFGGTQKLVRESHSFWTVDWHLQTPFFILCRHSWLQLLLIWEFWGCIFNQPNNS